MDQFAVRRLWPDGSHDYIGLSQSPADAQRALERDRRYWRRGPVRPSEYRVVAISAHDFNLHRFRHTCRSPDCP